MFGAFLMMLTEAAGQPGSPSCHSGTFLLLSGKYLSTPVYRIPIPRPGNSSPDHGIIPFPIRCWFVSEEGATDRLPVPGALCYNQQNVFACPRRRRKMMKRLPHGSLPGR